ncbi:hypothetical protein [Echinicola vietnamensis]|uniref:Uncharacterized protein n=1 Tax=Echinicola vietnamensis (strain DSM 17526 / LMG 23754 / KMM 6221) TaxID=926556 RepID=L0G2M9_ECHVK|nr:hypothetical protein [Echinicola vietnamensis]AGA79548.1 hypothetical protein Echvi_3325 [Echinicola vietnamensis DSM 17526]
MSNLGKTIHDHYCHGFGNTTENLSGSIIEAEGKDWIILRTPLKAPVFIDFSKHLPKKQLLIDAWCQDQRQQA